MKRKRAHSSIRARHSDISYQLVPIPGQTIARLLQIKLEMSGFFQATNKVKCNAALHDVRDASLTWNHRRLELCDCAYNEPFGTRSERLVMMGKAHAVDMNATLLVLLFCNDHSETMWKHLFSFRVCDVFLTRAITTQTKQPQWRTKLAE